ncbi:MAG: hypothetical protein JNN20_04800 [Betaproteobacteria bacterium]|nr:hypothetical protein [Betaproteobacteria bacterium]
MLGKLGELLNKDVGAIVKDAGKVLNTDVGTLAKGAGKVLNADLGDLVRSTPVPAESVQGETKTGPEKDVTPREAKASAAPAAKPVTPAPPPPPAAPTPAEPPAPAAAAFDPDATLKLGSPAHDDTSTLVLAPAADDSSLPQLADELVSRQRRAMPKGTSLLELLPHTAAEFSRPHATPAGELTSDPVTALYGAGGGVVIAVKLVQCWDADEAGERLTEVKNQSGKNYRMAPDKTWILGETLQGLVFSWTRDCYSFTATSPKGVAPLAKFLLGFPY